jgi:hypothetical protein
MLGVSSAVLAAPVLTACGGKVVEEAAQVLVRDGERTTVALEVSRNGQR